MNLIKVTFSFLIIYSLFLMTCLSIAKNYSGIADKLKSRNDTIDFVTKLNHNAFSLLNKNPDSARILSDSALKLSVYVQDDYSHAVSLINLAFSLKGTDDPISKINYIKKAVNILQTKNDKKGEAFIKTKIGDNYRKINNYEQALDFYISALKIYRIINDKKNIALLLNQKMGELYIENSKYDKAIDVLYQALKICEDSNDSSGKADALTNIGYFYIKQNNIVKANLYFKSAMSIYQKLDRKLQIAKCLVNLGFYYANTDSFYYALNYYLKALELYKQSQKVVRPEIYINIGRIYHLMRNFDKANSYYFKALENAIVDNSDEGILIAYLFLGALYKDIGNLSISKDYFLRCINIAKEINNIYWLSNVYNNLALISQEQKDFKSAYKYYKLYTDAKDSLSNREKITEITKIEMQYEQEKKDAVTQQEKKNQQTIILSFIIGSGLLLLLAFYIYINYRNKKKANEVLADKNKIISKEQEKSDNLLLNILPDTIARRLKDGEETIADYFEEASVVFIDQVDFTSKSSNAKPERVVQVLNSIYTEFDKIAVKYKLEKIKTIGDCYMAASGVPIKKTGHAKDAALFVLEVMQKIDGFVTDAGTEIRFRAGIDCGPVVAGIIGERKFIYDLWGDTVNTASRMEQYGIPGKIQVTERFKNSLVESCESEVGNQFLFEERGEMEIKGKGKMKTWFLFNNEN